MSIEFKYLYEDSSERFLLNESQISIVLGKIELNSYEIFYLNSVLNYDEIRFVGYESERVTKFYDF
ncbi:hypothetical protein CNEO3_50127 [Clostridium neonatale]|uniref:hypothetical protein n=1 Tax=Clostridium TaxID=1485 RepID=UPI00290B256F|nr:hypothetical protein [Clostridium sp.]MDU4476655.1 hypothetical protein [Clostridium sp.]CAI3671689.1 hypothetical protein CNEO3_50127 [Clostridium neonatale]